MRTNRWTVLFAVALAWGCQAPLTEPGPATGGPVVAEAANGPDATGVIREILEYPYVAGTLTRYLLEHPADFPTDLSVVHVGSQARILVRGADGVLREGTAADLRVGTTQRLWTTGIELRSYPRQVFATRIEIGS